jgi:hypothetical protein
MLTIDTGQFFYYGEAHSPAGLSEGGYISTGTFTVSGNQITGNEYFAPTEGLCSLTDICLANLLSPPDVGTVVQGVSLTFTRIIDNTGNLWTYNVLYNYSSGLAQIAGGPLGTWGKLPGMGGPFTGSATLSTELAPFAIDGNGVISAQNAAGTCAVSGQLSLIDPNHNAYSIAISYNGAGCTYPGATGTGLAYLDYTVSPTTLHMVIDLQAAGSTVPFAIIENDF